MVACCGYFWVVRRPKESVAALKKRLSGAGKNFHVVSLTLTVLETCVKNCGHRFHVKIAQKDFLSELVKIINPKVCLELYKIGLSRMSCQSISEQLRTKVMNCVCVLFYM